MAAGSTHDGTRVFGIDPFGYDQARPAYPDRVFELIGERCPIGPTTHIFEIGPGTGIATRRLLALGPGSLLAIEPNQPLAAYLAANTPDPKGRLQVQVATFAEAVLPAAAFQLGVAATTFHWLDPIPTLRKAAASLQPGGTWAMWWNSFGEIEGEDQFHLATVELLTPLQAEPAPDSARHPRFALNVDARLAELTTAGFVDVHHEVLRWSLPFDAARTRALYSTFPHIRTLPEPRHGEVLAELGRIVDDEFDGVVERTLLTPIYLARRL